VANWHYGFSQQKSSSCATEAQHIRSRKKAGRSLGFRPLCLHFSTTCRQDLSTFNAKHVGILQRSQTLLASKASANIATSCYRKSRIQMRAGQPLSRLTSLRQPKPAGHGARNPIHSPVSVALAATATAATATAEAAIEADQVQQILLRIAEAAVAAGQMQQILLRIIHKRHSRTIWTTQNQKRLQKEPLGTRKR
jgi:hypothetical protein